jgi:hypothetical protein
VNDETRAAARAIANAVTEPVARPSGTFASSEDERVRVLLPKSRGVAASRPDSLFEGHQVFVRQDLGVCYRGVWIDLSGTRAPGIVPVDELAPGPEPSWGF